MRFSRENYIEAVQSGEIDEDGVEAAFEVITDINETQVVPRDAALDYLLTSS